MIGGCSFRRPSGRGRASLHINREYLSPSQPSRGSWCFCQVPFGPRVRRRGSCCVPTTIEVIGLEMRSNSSNTDKSSLRYVWLVLTALQPTLPPGVEAPGNWGVGDDSGAGWSRCAILLTDSEQTTLHGPIDFRIDVERPADVPLIHPSLSGSHCLPKVKRILSCPSPHHPCKSLPTSPNSRPPFGVTQTTLEYLGPAMFLSHRAG
jgi:hypothetical protein